MRNPLEGCVLAVPIAAQPKLDKGQMVALRAAMDDGKNMPPSLRFNCRIARDIKAQLKLGVVFNGREFALNEAASPQVGKNRDGKAHVTFGLISGDDRITFAWTGAAVPVDLVRTAVRHDLGLKTPVVEVALNFSKAVVRRTNNRKGRRPAEEQRGRHDIPKKPAAKTTASEAVGIAVDAAYKRERGMTRRRCEQRHDRLTEQDLVAMGGKL